jgi:hypothetical protein
MDFNNEQVEDAIALVRDRARERATATYTEVFAAAGLPAPNVLHTSEPTEVTRFMKAFHDTCRDRGNPPLDSLVVHAVGDRRGRPGRGYFKVNGWPDPFAEGTSAEQMVASVRHWEQERDTCFTSA